MDVIQQHMLDTWRAAQHGETAPPLPGRDDLSTVRALRELHRFHQVLAGCPVGPGLRAPLTRLLRRKSPHWP
ncbi:hypothetical protein ACWGI8_14990 [Streptomyces sp. NPDC054841]